MTNSSTSMRSARGWGWGGFSEHTWLSLTIKSVTFFKTLGTELQMCPIMSWDVLPGYERCVGYGKRVCCFAETVKGSAKHRRRKSNRRVYGVTIPTARARSWVPRVSWNPTHALFLHPRGCCSALGDTTAISQPLWPPARGLPEAYRRHRSLPRRSRSLRGQRLQTAVPPRVRVPPRHAEGAIVIIKNKSSSLSIVCTYWSLLPSSQTHLQYSQKPSACLFSLCCLAWSRDKCIPCYSLPLRRHL